MNEAFIFRPEQRLGMIFQVVAILFLAAGAVLGLWGAALANIGPVFLLYLLPGLLAAGIVPLLAYCIYALRTGAYTLERDGIRLRWGLRVEEIPMDAVLWVHPSTELEMVLPLPWLRWPGAVLGVRRLSSQGEVEFLSESTQRLVLIGTTQRAYAISPADPAGFLHAFQRFTEMGSLTPLAARSVHPTLLLQQVWAARAARVLLIGSLSLSLLLLVWVSLAVPGREAVSLGFRPDGLPSDPGPSVRLLLLPVINSIFFLTDVFLGLFFFRHAESQPLAYLLWGVGALTPAIFLVAVFNIL